MLTAPRTVTFAMTGVLHRNGRALRQIALLEQMVDQVHVIAAGAEGASGLFGATVELHDYELPTAGGWRFFLDLHRRVKSLAKELSTDVYHASDLYVLPALAAEAGRRTSGLVYDARELYPFVQGTAGRPWATLFWSQLEGRFVTHADLVMTVSESIADRLAASYGISRPIVVPNVPNHPSVSPSSYLRDTSSAFDTDFLVLHLGQMKQGRGCATLIDAIAKTRDVHGVFVGQGPELGNLGRLARVRDVVDRITFIPSVPYDQVLNVAAGADIGVSLLEDTCLNHRLALPNKLFEYLAAGLPVVVSDFPELGTVVKEYEVGLTADPSSADSVAASIERLQNDHELLTRFKRNTPRVAADYNWDVAADRMRAGYRVFDRHG